MIEDNQVESIPNEMLMYIFGYLKPKHLSKCREVCWRWKLVVDSFCASDVLWRRHCQLDFADIYEDAYYKRKPELSWNNLYRSLVLWSKLQYATEIYDEFAYASFVRNEICDFKVLGKGQIGVHTREGIAYYDIKTLNRSSHHTLSGDYLRYVENDYAVLVLGFTSDLYVTRKNISPHNEINTSFTSVNCFYLHNNLLYYVTTNNSIYICDLLTEKIKSSLLTRMGDGIMCLGYKDGHLNVLTYQRDIFTIVGTQNVFQCALDDSANLLHGLYQFNLFENFDWRIYFQWMFVLRRTIPRDAVRDIIVVKIYGNVVFVGSRYGLFRIYHSPFLNNNFDIFYAQPVKEYNFMETKNCPVLSDCPIIQIDVLEEEDSHKVFVGMPKKIAVLNFSHDFKNMASTLDFGEQSVEIVNVNK